MKTRYIAILAVLAMVLAGSAAWMSEGSDADPSYEVVDFNIGTKAGIATNAAHMKVVVYVDKVIMIDINGMDLNHNIQYAVGVKSSEDGADGVVVGPVSALNGRIYIDGANHDAAGKDLLNASYTTTVDLYAYGATSSYNTGTGLDVTTVRYNANVVGLSLLTNHSANWAGVNAPNGSGSGQIDYVSSPDTSGKTIRNIKTDMSGAAYPTELVDPTGKYVLKGWAHGHAENSTILVEPEQASIEDIMIQIAENEANLGAYPVIDRSTPASPVVNLYAIWKANNLKLFVGTGDDSTAYDTENVLGSGKVKASCTSEVVYGSFGLVRVEQIKEDSYTLTPTVKKISTGTTLVAATAGPSASDDYEIFTLANGMWKIIPKTDLYVDIAVADSGDTQSSYSFSINEITNTGSNGNAQLSLDLYDYKVHIHQAHVNDGYHSAQDIGMDGTYYRTLAGSSDSEVRIYGNIDSLTITDAVTKDESAHCWTAKVDGQPLAAADIGSGKTLYNGEVTLAEEKQTYDLVLDLYQVNIYAARGVWTLAATAAEADDDGEGPHEAVDAVSEKIVYTPWALYQAE